MKVVGFETRPHDVAQADPELRVSILVHQHFTQGAISAAHDLACHSESSILECS